jgi:hypothetical protein
MTDSATIFDRQAASYEAPRRRLIPPLDAVLAAVRPR